MKIWIGSYNILIISAILILLSAQLVFPQTKYVKSSGTISFFSSAPVEDIKAETESFISEMELESGVISFTVPITGFVFKKSLMRQHFNEQYMESEKFPNAVFTGTLIDKPLSLPPSGTLLKTRVHGTLNIRGIDQEVDEEVFFAASEGVLDGSCKFKVKVADFGIKIPKMFIKNIAEIIEISVDVRYIKAS